MHVLVLKYLMTVREVAVVVAVAVVAAVVAAIVVTIIHHYLIG